MMLAATNPKSKVDATKPPRVILLLPECSEETVRLVKRIKDVRIDLYTWEYLKIGDYKGTTHRTYPHFFFRKKGKNKGERRRNGKKQPKRKKRKKKSQNQLNRLNRSQSQSQKKKRSLNQKFPNRRQHLSLYQ